jgi:8-oxo-dGTP pyrophosphatase MutT (NUDIX family)
MKKWQVIRSVYVKKSPWVNWRIDTCRLPNGHRIEEYHVSEIPPGVGVVALTPGKELILVRQYRHGARRIIYELPGGMISARDRTPLNAARRELREESGYTSRNWRLLAECFLHPPSQDNLVFIYLALNARRTSHLSLDQEEQIETVQYPLERVVQLIQRRRTLSLGTVAAIMLARERLGI